MSTMASTVSPAATESTKPFENGLEEVLAAIAYIDLHVRWAVERARTHGLDPNDEFRGLYISEGQIDTLLSAEVGHDLWPNGDGQKAEDDQWPEIIESARDYWQARIDASREAGIDLRLDDLTRRFGLSQTESIFFWLAWRQRSTLVTNGFLPICRMTSLRNAQA